MDFPMLFAEMLPLLTAAALLGTVLLSAMLIALPRDRPREIGFGGFRARLPRLAPG